MAINWTDEGLRKDWKKIKEYKTWAETELLTHKDLYHDCREVLQHISYHIDCVLPTDEDVRESMFRIYAYVLAIGHKIMAHEDALRKKRGQPKKLRDIGEW